MGPLGAAVPKRHSLTPSQQLQKQQLAGEKGSLAGCVGYVPTRYSHENKKFIPLWSKKRHKIFMPHTSIIQPVQ
jgi:hypothetical protein